MYCYCMRYNQIQQQHHAVQERPYNHDSTASRLLSEVKHDLARLVLRWGTTLESLVLFFLFCLHMFYLRVSYQIPYLSSIHLLFFVLLFFVCSLVVVMFYRYLSFIICCFMFHSSVCFLSMTTVNESRFH